jgi:hypothetical protein
MYGAFQLEIKHVSDREYDDASISVGEVPVAKLHLVQKETSC